MVPFVLRKNSPKSGFLSDFKKIVFKKKLEMEEFGTFILKPHAIFQIHQDCLPNPTWKRDETAWPSHLSYKKRAEFQAHMVTGHPPIQHCSVNRPDSKR